MKLIEKVMHILNEDERTRDNDNLLIAKIWYSESKHTDVVEFLKAFSAGNLTSPESIRRCRQKLQEETPGLRGKKWTQRHNVNHEFIYEL